MMIRSHTLRVVWVVLACIATAAPASATNVTGTVRNGSGFPVAGATINVNGLATQPSGNVTAANGTFTLIVPAGTYDFQVAPTGTSLAPTEVTNVVVGASGVVALGIITLPAGFILTGTVRTSGMSPVVGGDIDVTPVGADNKLYTPGDNTTSAGTFSVVVPAGTYDVDCKPPSGPLLVAQRVANVVVAAPTNIGFVTLPAGVTLTGTVIDAGTFAPISGLDTDTVDEATGLKVITPGDNTNASGIFSVIVPSNATYTVSIDPAGGVPYVGRQVMHVAVNGPTSMGQVTLSPGFFISGVVKNPQNQVVVNGKIEVRTALGAYQIFTPNGKTSTTGTFQVVVPGGSYRVTGLPPVGTVLATFTTAVQNVSANLALPVMTLPTGYYLSGVLTGFNNAPEPAADIDVFNAATGLKLITPGDKTDAVGHYAVIVPAGTFTVKFFPQHFSLSQAVSVPGVVVANANVTLGATCALTPTLTFIQPAGDISLPQTGPIFFDAALYHPFGVVQTPNVTLSMLDPAGVETVLFGPTPITLNPNDLIILYGVQFFLPTVNPAYLNLPFLIRLRSNDAVTGLELDHDEYQFFIH